MKTMKRKLTMSITAALVLVLSISIGATAIRNTKNTHKKIYKKSATEEAARVYPPAVVKYKGELIPLVQLREVTIRDTAIQKKK